MSKEIKITVPDGKTAEWKNGVLTLVERAKYDPEAIERYRIYLLRRQEDYRRKKRSAEMQTSAVTQ